MNEARGAFPLTLFPVSDRKGLSAIFGMLLKAMRENLMIDEALGL
jgi:hypothetical protein